jgi:hypothetical protein
MSQKSFSSSLDPRVTPGHCDQTFQGIEHLTSYNLPGFSSPTDLISSLERGCTSTSPVRARAGSGFASAELKATPNPNSGLERHH